MDEKSAREIDAQLLYRDEKSMRDLAAKFLADDFRALTAPTRWRKLEIGRAHV